MACLRLSRGEAWIDRSALALPSCRLVQLLMLHDGTSMAVARRLMAAAQTPADPFKDLHGPKCAATRPSTASAGLLHRRPLPRLPDESVMTTLIVLAQVCCDEASAIEGLGVRGVHLEVVEDTFVHHLGLGGCHPG